MDVKPDVKDLLGSDTLLSKGVLGMKFMKKSRALAEKQIQEEENRKIYSDEINDGMKKTGNSIFVETSIANCKGLIEGRLSFLGANPEIEKIMASELGDMLNDIEMNKDKDVSDMEMAKSLSSVAGTIQKKFNNKRKRNFIKPSSDI